MTKIILSFLPDETGATAIEYKLIAAGIFDRDDRGGEDCGLEPERGLRIDK